MDIEFLSYGIGTVCALFAVWNVGKLLASEDRSEPSCTGRAQFSGIERERADRVAQFQKKIRAILDKISLIEEHSGEYFMVLNENGWARIISLIDPIDKVNELLVKLTSQNKLAQAEAVVKWMETCATGIDAPDDLRDVIGDELERVRLWDQEIADTIVNVVAALRDAAENTKQLGIERKRKRKPTLLAVNELMNTLEKKSKSKTNAQDW